MFVRNFLTAGDFVTLLPFGLLATIQYSDKGKIEKVFIGADHSGQEVTKELLPIILKSNLVPRSIMIQGGTSFVTGVFQIKDFTLASGNIPDCVNSSFITAISESPNNVKFYAGSVSSLAAIYRGAVNVRRWLTGSKFELLPGYPVPANLTEDTFVKMVEQSRLPFSLPEVFGYLVFHQGMAQYHSLGFKLVQVMEEPTHFTNGLGQIWCDIFVDGLNDPKLTVPYGVCAKYNIHAQDFILLDEHGEILKSYSVGQTSSSYPTTLVCDVCGKVIPVNLNGETKCTNMHCGSRLYTATNRFLERLGLPEAISYEKYKALVKKTGKLYTILDVLDEPEYKDRTFDVTLNNLLIGVLPYTIPITLINKFCEFCSNSPASVEYYLSYPEVLSREFSGYGKIDQLTDWAADPENLNILNHVLQDTRIHIVSSAKKFEGAPTLRNWRILLTGEFSHGPQQEIQRILRSYSAEIVYKPEDANCLIIGDIGENLNGSFIHQMKSANKKVFKEFDFFRLYEIDDDLRANL